VIVILGEVQVDKKHDFLGFASRNFERRG